MWLKTGLLSSSHPYPAGYQLQEHILFILRPYRCGAWSQILCEILPNFSLVASLYGNFPSNERQSVSHSEESCREECVCLKRQTFLLRKDFFFSCQESWQQTGALHLRSRGERQHHGKKGDKGGGGPCGVPIGAALVLGVQERNQLKRRASSKELLIKKKKKSPECSTWNSNEWKWYLGGVLVTQNPTTGCEATSSWIPQLSVLIRGNTPAVFFHLHKGFHL